MIEAGDGFDVRSLAVTLRAGASISPHRHRWGQLVFACSGVMHVSTETATWLTPATKAIWIPAQVEHRIVIQGEVAMRTLYIAASRAGLLSSEPVVLEVAPLLRELVLHIVQIGMLISGSSEHERLTGVLIDLIRAARCQDLFLPLPRDPRALRMALGLQEQLAELLELKELASASGASLRTLQRIFPQETGVTLNAWRQKARLVRAVACLSSGASVTTTALNCGYQSVAAFISAFSRQFGVTPGRYASTARSFQYDTGRRSKRWASSRLVTQEPRRP